MISESPLKWDTDESNIKPSIFNRALIPKKAPKPQLNINTKKIQINKFRAKYLTPLTPLTKKPNSTFKNSLTVSVRRKSKSSRIFSPKLKQSSVQCSLDKEEKE